MTPTRGLRPLWRTGTTLVLVTYSVACTHLPSGEKAFESFESCFAANLGLAALGGVGVGVLGAKLTEGLTGNASTGKKVGAAAGIAAAAMIAMHAWQKCGAVYNKSEPIGPPPKPVQPPPASAGPQKAQLSLSRLEVRVEGTENDPPKPEFDLHFAAADAGARDIKAQFRHRVEIVRFMATEDDRMVLADNNGQPLRDGAGREIPLDAAHRMPREKLAWTAIAEPGKEDYVEDVVIQQGARLPYRHTLQVPPRANLPLPLPVPMRYTLTVEADRLQATRSVDFAILGTADRPRRYSASASASALRSLGAPARAQPSASAAPTGSGASGAIVTLRASDLYSDTGASRKKIGALPKGTHVRVIDRGTAIVKNKPVDWVKVDSDGGAGGWLPASRLSGGGN